MLVFGTFDGIHLGHDNFFRQAKELGDHLTAVVALDETVASLKKKPAERSEQQRLADVKAHPLVDDARLGSATDKYAAIRELKPAVIALGYDQTWFTAGIEEHLREHELHARVVRLEPFYPDQYKSSILNKK